MDGIRQYLIVVTTAALICGIVTKLSAKGMIGTAMKMLCGVFLTLAVISPLVKIRIANLENYTLSIQSQGQALAQEGEKTTRDAVAEVIINRTEEYILDKAETLGVSLSVEVILGEDLVPKSVRLEGNVSPYAKTILAQYISDSFGVDAEEVEWIL